MHGPWRKFSKDGSKYGTVSTIALIGPALNCHACAQVSHIPCERTLCQQSYLPLVINETYRDRTFDFLRWQGAFGLYLAINSGKHRVFHPPNLAQSRGKHPERKNSIGDFTGNAFSPPIRLYATGIERRSLMIRLLLFIALPVKSGRSTKLLKELSSRSSVYKYFGFL